uniref:Serpentine receptor class gamma n=1 Tax=Steinernema glaseri TaxID=37863 RepID=A0A1I8ADG9_9BILA
MHDSSSPRLEMSDVLRMIENIFWSFAVVGVCYVMKCLRRARLLHYNLKMILTNLSIAMIGYGCCRLAKNMESIAHYYGIGPRNMAYRTSMLVAKIYFVTSMLIGLFCVLMLTVERTVATFVPERYEQMKKTGKGFVVFALFWAVSVGISIMLNLFWQKTNPQTNDNTVLFSSFLVSVNIEFLLGVIYAAIPASVANGVLVCFLYNHNKKRRIQLDRSKLNVRYQYAENIVTTRLLLALTGADFVGSVVAATLISCYYVARRNELMSDNDLLFIEQSFHVMMSMYAIWYNVIFLAMHRPNRDQLIRDVKSIEGHRLSFKNEGAVYFSYLSRQWNA